MSGHKWAIAPRGKDIFTFYLSLKKDLVLVICYGLFVISYLWLVVCCLNPIKNSE